MCCGLLENGLQLPSAAQQNLVQIGTEIGGRDQMEALQKKTKSLLANPSGGEQKLADGSTGEYFFPYSWIW